MRIATVDVTRADDDWVFTVGVGLGMLTPESVQVELYAESLEGGPPVGGALARSGWISDSEGVAAIPVYRGRVPAGRPASDYTPRVVPHHPEAHVPLEVPHIRWPR